MKSLYIKPLSVLLIACLGINVYSNTLHCSFHFDDFLFIVNNPAIRDIHDLHNIWHYYHGRFVTFLTLALNYHFNGLDVFGYHLFNLAVHLISAILVWWLVLLTFTTPFMIAPPVGESGNKITEHAEIIALFAGLVFVSHPIQTEAVTNIWQRAASMAALFYLASLCLYVKSKLLEETQLGMAIMAYMGAFLIAVLAMFTKENTVTLPLVILIYEFTFFKTKRNLNWKSVLPFLFILFIIPLTLVFLKSQTFQDMHGQLMFPTAVSSPMHYFLTQIRVMVTYIRLVFIPVNQNIDYDYPHFKDIFELPVFLSFLFLVAVFYWTKSLFLKYRLVSFSIVWFFLALFIPESSFWAMTDVISEHRLYLPMVGFSIFLVCGMYYLVGMHSFKRMVILLTFIIACNSVLTYQRNKVWENELTFWADAVSKSPHKERPYNNRGVAYASQGLISQAIMDFTKTIEINPNNDNNYVNRGIAYTSQNDFFKAIADFTQAIEINPKNAKAYYNRGIIYYRFKKYNKAREDFYKVESLGVKINAKLF